MASVSALRVRVLDKSTNQRVKHAFERSTLRLKQGREKEGMSAQLDRPDFAVVIVRGYEKAGRSGVVQEKVLIRRIEAVTTVIPLFCPVHSVDLPGPRAGSEMYRTSLLNQGTAERGDDLNRGARLGFGVTGFHEAEDFASVFEQGMLEPAAGAEKRDGASPRVSDREECAGLVGVRAGRNQPDPGEMLEPFTDVADQFGGVDPLPFEGRHRGGRQGQRAFNPLVGENRRLVIPHQCDARNGGPACQGPVFSH